MVAVARIACAPMCLYIEKDVFQDSVGADRTPRVMLLDLPGYVECFVCRVHFDWSSLVAVLISHETAACPPTGCVAGASHCRSQSVVFRMSPHQYCSLLSSVHVVSSSSTSQRSSVL